MKFWWAAPRRPPGKRSTSLIRSHTNSNCAVDEVRPGEVLVAAAGGSLRSGIWGELLSTAAQKRGCAGALVDGAVRDISKMQRINFTVFAAGTCPLDSRDRQRVKAVDVPVEIGGVTIEPGDLVFADADGVVVVPRSRGRSARESLGEGDGREPCPRRNPRRCVGHGRLSQVWSIVVRIGIIGLQHESNTFQSGSTTWEHFQQGALLTGQAIAREYGAAHHEIGGFFQGLDEEGVTAVPVFFAWAMPGGPVTARALDRLLQSMLIELKNAGPLDGLLVAPHGAAVSESRPDMDGAWLRELRSTRRPANPDRRHARSARQSLGRNAAGD